MTTMSKYKVPKTRGWHYTHDELENTFRLWGVHEFNVSPNVMMARINSTQLSLAERSVTVSFMKDGRQVVLSMDEQDSPTGNLKALQLCIDDMRMIERRGLAETMQSAYLQLAGPEATRDPHEVLGIRPGATREEITAMFRVKAKSAHPDRGGSEAAMAELNRAYEELLNRVPA